jgi:hypothetical protein
MEQRYHVAGTGPVCIAHSARRSLDPVSGHRALDHRLPVACNSRLVRSVNAPGPNQANIPREHGQRRPSTGSRLVRRGARGCSRVAPTTGSKALDFTVVGLSEAVTRAEVAVNATPGTVSVDLLAVIGAPNLAGRDADRCRCQPPMTSRTLPPQRQSG